MKMLLIGICLVSLLISIPGFIHKAGYSFFRGLIPGYNIYLFFSILDFSPILLIIFSLGLVFLPDRAFVATLFFAILPFIVCECFGKGKISGFFTLFFPFIMYPFLAYFSGNYVYAFSDVKVSFIRRNKILCFSLIIFSVYMYANFIRLIEGNKFIDKNSEHYVNDIYMSDGRIYKNYLNENEKKMYMYMLDSAREGLRGGEINFDEFGCRNYDDCSGLVATSHDALLIDHPELITYAGYTLRGDDNKFYLSIDFAQNNMLAVRLAELKISREIDNLKKKTKNMNEREKIEYVYDWVGRNNTYDDTFTWTAKNQSIYNVFIHNNAVCAGFAKTSQVIFQNIGVESYIIIGNTTGPHMWNIVRYGDKYYYYDSTVAASAHNQGESWYYNGLIQEKMNDYISAYVDWYPEVSKVNGLYVS